MKRNDWSRKNFLSLGALGGLAWLGIDCGGDSDNGPAGGSGGTGGGSPAGSGGRGGSGGGAPSGSGGTGGTGGGAGNPGNPPSRPADAASARDTAVDSSSRPADAGGVRDGANRPPDSGAAADRPPSDSAVQASCTGNITVNVSLNHANGAHSLTIPFADIMAGATKVYNARGASNHDHFFQITAADFTTLRNGGVVTKFGCNGGDHEFVMSCGMAPAGAAPNCGGAANTCSATAATLCT